MQIMKLKHLIYILPFLAACTPVEQYSERISLKVGFVGTFDSRAASVAVAYTDSVPSSDNPLKADLWFSTTRNTFRGTQTVSSLGDEVDVHTTITYYGPTITVPDPYDAGKSKYLHYPPHHGTIYCVGLYPQGAWINSADGLTATADIDGDKDLMYAAQKEGTDENALIKSRQIYNHELTWLKIRVYGREHSTAETWGKIRKISVKSAASAKVTFSTDKVGYYGEKSIYAFDDVSGLEIPIMSTEIGSVLAAPVTDGRYFVDIECENHMKTSIPVTLTDNDGNQFSGSTKGLVFVLTLYFQNLATVECSSSLSEWETDAGVLILD